MTELITAKSVMMSAMRITTLLLIMLVVSIAANAQKPQADEDGPRLIKGPEAKFPSDGIAMGIGGVIRVFLDIDKTGKPAVKQVTGPPAPCSNLDDPRAGALRDAAVAAAKQATFEASNRATTTTLRFIVPYPPVPESDRAKARYISAGILNTKATSVPDPIYPTSAHRPKAGGMITVMITVDYDGTVLGAAGSYGDPVFFRGASEAACRAKFPPITFSGIPFKVSGVINYFVP